MEGKIEHVFIDYYGIKYEDYTLYTNLIPNSYSEDKMPVVMNNRFAALMSSYLIKDYCDSSFKPAMGDEVHVVPDSTLAVQDIRNHYKLKRNFDEGVCNVISPIRKNGWHSVRYHHWMVNAEYKIIVCYWDPEWKKNKKSRSVIESEMLQFVPEDKRNAYYSLWYQSEMIIALASISKSYRAMLLKQNKKPCIYYENLPMDRNELTLEQLIMLYETGRNDSAEAEKNYAIQLSALAQTNWKEYPSTMHELFDKILRYTGCHYKYKNNSRNQPKQIREILEYTFHGSNSGYFCIEKDFQLMSRFLEHILRIGDCKFVTTEQLRNKITTTNLTSNLVERFYHTMVKITPKRHEAEENTIS